jgi:hypothetical protein
MDLLDAPPITKAFMMCVALRLRTRCAASRWMRHLPGSIARE